MEIVLNMFVALCVGMSYVVGYLLAISSLIFLVLWVVDGRYNSNLSDKYFYLLKSYLPEKDEDVTCKRCEDTKTINVDEKYCSLCGKKIKKSKTSAYEIQVEKMTNRIVIFALAAILFYSISTSLFAVFVILSVVSSCLYYALKASESKRQSC